MCKTDDFILNKNSFRQWKAFMSKLLLHYNRDQWPEHTRSLVRTSPPFTMYFCVSGLLHKILEMCPVQRTDNTIESSVLSSLKLKRIIVKIRSTSFLWLIIIYSSWWEIAEMVNKMHDTYYKTRGEFIIRTENKRIISCMEWALCQPGDMPYLKQCDDRVQWRMITYPQAVYGWFW